MDTLTAPPAVRTRTRGRVGLLAAALLAGNLCYAAGVTLWAMPGDGTWYTYPDVAGARDRWWLVVTLTAAALAVALPAQAVAGAALARERGAGWATAGGTMLWLSAAVQAVTLGGWATAFYLITGPGVDRSAADALFAATADDPRVHALPMIGLALAAVGTAVQAVGLWRARTVPRWVPIAAALIVPTFFVPGGQLLSLVATVPAAAAAVAIGWYAWRRA